MKLCKSVWIWDKRVCSLAIPIYIFDEFTHISMQCGKFFPANIQSRGELLGYKDKLKTWKLPSRELCFGSKDVCSACGQLLPVLTVWSVSKLCLTLCDPMDCSPPGSSVPGILQARMLEWVAMASSRGSSWPRDPIRVSYICSQILYCWATREASHHWCYWASLIQGEKKISLWYQ